MIKNLKLKGSKVTLNGNLLTGDTYRIKDFIKSNIDGKWDGERKGWIVNPEKMESVMNSGWCYIFPETTAPTSDTSKHTDRWVNSDGSLAEDF